MATSRDRQGYILIDKNMCEWKWWQKHNTVIVFMWLLMKAQFHESYFCGQKIKRGQVATTLENIEKSNSLTRQEVRTAISNLKSTNAITVKRCSKFTIITIVNYDEYQNPTITPTTGQQSNNNHVTIKKPHTNKYKKYNKDKEKENESLRSDSPFGGYERGTDEFRNRSHLLLKPEEGTVDDIPTVYRDGTYQAFDNFADYCKWRNQ